MKRIIFILGMLCFGLNIQADKVLTEDQWNRIPQETRDHISQEKKVNEVSKWSNIGKEIGVTVNECLKAIESSAQRLSNTHLGRLAIGIVVWKLLYKDILGIVIGCVMIVFCIISWKRWYQGCKSGKDEDAAVVIVNIISNIVYFVAAMICFFS